MCIRSSSSPSTVLWAFHTIQPSSFALRFLLLLSFSSPILSRRRLYVYHRPTSTRGHRRFLGDRLYNGSPCYRSVVCLSVPSCPACLFVCDVRALSPNGWTDQDETWHAGRPRPWPHCVRWGPSSPSPKGHRPDSFRSICVAAKWLHESRCHLVWS